MTAPAPADGGGGGRARLVRLGGVLVLVGAVAAAAWTAARSIETPSQRAAKTQAPGRSTITAPVARRRIASTVTLRWRAVAQDQFSVEALPVAEGAAPVVTDLAVQVGQQVIEGQRLLSITDRPVLVLAGDLEPYRSLRPGDRGSDVAQVERSLARLGLLGDAPDDLYGAATKVAIRELYARAGSTANEYEPEGPTRAELAEAVATAQREVDAAVVADDRATWQEAVASRRAARQALTDFDEASGPTLPVGELAFAPRLPMVVATVRARRGRKISGPSMVLRSSALGLRAAAESAAVSEVEVGQRVHVTGAGPAVEAIVSAVASKPSPDGTFEVAATPVEALAPDLLGEELLGDVALSAVDEPVLAVPVAALVTLGDGSTVVVRSSGDGDQQRIRVETGAVADGMVEIERSASPLEAGDQVVIGR